MRGRDVGRDSAQPIWIPPADASPLEELRRVVPPDVLQRLRARSGVSGRQRNVLEFHDRIPSWFTSGPKVVIPEISTGPRLRVTVDPYGCVLPLHSTLSIRAESVDSLEELRKFLSSESVAIELKRNAGSLKHGAIRITVPLIRRLRVQLIARSCQDLASRPRWPRSPA